MDHRRRAFLRTTALTTLGAVGAIATPETPPSSAAAQLSRRYQGADLSGWTVVVGDGVYAGPGEAPVTLEDIATVHLGSHSDLQANLRLRRIMAHNITYLRIDDPQALSSVHTASFRFRLPYQPAPDSLLMGQTIEGGLAVWDGRTTRRDYQVLFQWVVNPLWQERYGHVHSWSAPGGGSWQEVGALAPGTDWHTLRVVMDLLRGTCALAIDGTPYPAAIIPTERPEGWGTEVSARLQAEIVSVYPEPDGLKLLHVAEVQDWTWVWEPARSCTVALPMIQR